MKYKCHLLIMKKFVDELVQPNEENDLNIGMTLNPVYQRQASEIDIYICRTIVIYQSIN